MVLSKTKTEEGTSCSQQCKHHREGEGQVYQWDKLINAGHG